MLLVHIYVKLKPRKIKGSILAIKSLIQTVMYNLHKKHHIFQTKLGYECTRFLDDTLEHNGTELSRDDNKLLTFNP